LMISLLRKQSAFVQYLLHDTIKLFSYLTLHCPLDSTGIKVSSYPYA